MGTIIPKAILLALLGLLGGIATARAAGPSRVDPADAVMQTSGLTYADLAQHFAPDLHLVDGEYRATHFINVRHAGGPEDEARPEEPRIAGITRLDLGPKAASRMLLLFDFGPADGAVQEVMIMALYDMTGEPRLLDALDTGFDRFAGFAEPPLHPLSQDSDIVVVTSSHFNAGEAFTATTPILVHDNRLTPVDTIFTYNWQVCGQQATEALALKTVKNHGERKALRATLSFTSITTGEACGEDADTTKTERKRTVSVTYRWDNKTQTLRGNSDPFRTLRTEVEPAEQ